ncbi:MAG TPA: MFS transporter [Vicinamibacteria bacterium]|nr:MFS transporter [Vicinamibacteria bacterium]
MAEAAESRAARNANVAAVMTFAAFLGLGFALPFLPLFVQELGVLDPVDAAQWAGVLIGVGPLLAGLLAPFWGGLADRHGYKRIALLALTAIGLAQVVASLAQSPLHVLVSRVLSGLFGGVGPLGLAMASGSSQREGGASKAIGKIQAAQILAAGFGPLLGGTLASFLGIRAAFWGASISCLFAALAVGLFYVDEGTGAPAPRRDPAAPSLAAPGSFFTALVFVVFFVNFASRSFTPILPAQLESFGVAPSSLAFSTGVLISVYSIAAAVSSFGFGRLAAGIDPVRLIGLSLFLSLLAALAMAHAATFGAFLGVALVYGLVSGGGLTLGYSIGSRRFPEASRGASFGRLSGAALIGGAVAPAIAAFVARSALVDVYWMNALIYAILIGTAVTLLRAPVRA